MKNLVQRIGGRGRGRGGGGGWGWRGRRVGHPRGRGGGARRDRHGSQLFPSSAEV